MFSEQKMLAVKLPKDFAVFFFFLFFHSLQYTKEDSFEHININYIKMLFLLYTLKKKKRKKLQSNRLVIWMSAFAVVVGENK